VHSRQMPEVEHLAFEFDPNLRPPRSVPALDR
jgi:hypothetical protein